jgi:soluble lytic murein transglycosylase-like protein
MTSSRLSQIQAALPLRLSRWASQLFSAELCFGVDPFLLAAIVDRESLGGEALTPKGPTGTGDGGHGRGLAQIDDRSHIGFTTATFADGGSLWQDPAFNLLYAARLLRNNIVAFNGNTRAAVAAYNCGNRKVARTLMSLEPTTTEAERNKAIDALTTGGDYASDVLRRRERFFTGSPA